MFNFTAVYGMHTIQDRRGLWEKLGSLLGIQQGPWIVMEDFNSILNEDDRKHGTPIQDIEIRDFMEFLTDSGMTELATSGRYYTWTNNYTYSRIYRVIVNAG